MKCIIVDDEKLSRDLLSIMISKHFFLELIKEFNSAIDALKYLNEQNEVDLIFLDIHMPNFSGFDFIRTLKKKPQIILVTSDKNFAIDAFGYDCITDYLVKPIQQERFDKALNKVEFKIYNKTNDLLNNSDYVKDIYINIDKRLIKIDISTIKYIHANGDYIEIKTETSDYLVHTTLKKIEEKLPNSFFIKIHRSYIINLNKIIDIQDSTVLIGKDIVPISKNKKEIFMKHLNLL